MDLELILSSHSPATVYAVSEWAANHRCPLHLIYSEPVPFRLADGIQLSFRSYRHRDGNFYDLIDQAVSLVKSTFVFMVSDLHLGTLTEAPTLVEIAPSLLGLASFSASLTAGIHPVEFNPFFGTLYAREVFREVGAWVADDPSPVVDWARRVRDRGWIHRTAFVPGSADPSPVDSSQG